MSLKNKKHILLLTPGFPEDENDSKCIPALQLFLQELIKRDQFTVTVISFQYPYRASFYAWNGINVYALAGKNKKGIRKIFTLNKAFYYAQKINRKHHIDFVHSLWLGECTLVGNRVAKRLKIKHSCTLMGQDVLKQNPYLNKIKSKPEFIAISNFQNEKLIANSRFKANHVIPWGIEDLSKFVSDQKTIDVIGVGWLNENKNFVQFLEIIDGLKKFIPEVRAEIIGEGEQSNHLKNRVEKLKLSENVKLLGSMGRQETLNKVAQSRVLLHPTKYESFGLVFIEAVALGVKVFTKAVGIAPEIQEITTFEQTEEAVNFLNDFLTSDHKINWYTPYKIESTVDAYIKDVFLN